MEETTPMPETPSEPATRLYQLTTGSPDGGVFLGEKDNDAVAQQFQTQAEPEQAVTGMLVSAPYHLKDLQDRSGCFYCFPDIRVRHPGKYSLRFSLMRMPSTDPTTTEPEQILQSVLSMPFTVYSIRDFPGVDESTALSKKFAQQGVGIPIRNKGRLKADAEDVGNFE
ncbi:hypothetical protein GGI23_000557 [Coemansia sp. RSA 2559]|nr:hypothetical protein GGI23_000557 [Coemansia sp. RSA 2559]KAJ2869083.1 hypothetical protein GGI22_000467 [Coemansia erecta]